MSTAANIRAGGAFVEISTDSSKADRELNAFTRRLGSVAARMSSIGQSLLTTGLGTAAGLAVPTKFALDAVGIARKFQAVFKEQTMAANEFADALAGAMNRSSYDIKQAYATYQAFFRGLGFGTAEANKLSQAATRAGADFAAFFNVSESETLMRFIAALSGSPEVLDQFGVNIREIALDQELLRLGINKSTKAATENEKAIARLSVISRALKNQGATGISISSVGDPDQQFRALVSRLKELAITVGNDLLPVLGPLAVRLTSVIRAANEWAQTNPRLVGTIGSIATAATAVVLPLGGLLIFAGKIVSSVGMLSPALKGLGMGFKGLAFAVQTAYVILSGTTKLIIAGRFTDAVLAFGNAVKFVGTSTGAIGLLAGKFLLVAAAIAIVGYAIYKLTDTTAKLKREAEAASKAMRQQFAFDNTDLQKLNSLANANDKNSKSGREAEKIAQRLKARYGDLGIEVNRTTGSVNGLAAAMQKIAAIQERAAKAALSAELKEAQENLVLLRKESESYGQKYKGGVPGLVKDIGRTVVGEGPLFGGDSSVTISQRAVEKRIEDQVALVRRLKDQLRGISDPSGNDNDGVAQIIKENKESEEDLSKDLIRIFRDRRKARQTELENQIDDIREQSAQVRSTISKLADIELDRNGKTAKYHDLIRQMYAFEAESAKMVADAVEKAEEQKRLARSKTIRESLGDSDMLQKQEEKNLEAFREMMDRAISGAAYAGGGSSRLFQEIAENDLMGLDIQDPEQLKRFQEAIEATTAAIREGGIDSVKKLSDESWMARNNAAAEQSQEFGDSLARKLAEMTGDGSLKMKLDADQFRREAEKSLEELRLLSPEDRQRFQEQINGIAGAIESGAMEAGKELRISFSEGMSIGAAASKELQQRIAMQIGGRVNNDEAKKQTSILGTLRGLVEEIKNDLGVEAGK